MKPAAFALVLARAARVAGVTLVVASVAGVPDDSLAADARASRPERGLAPAGPFAGLPVVDRALAEKIASGALAGPVRVIVQLGYLPHEAVFAEVGREHAAALAALEADRVALLEPMAARREFGPGPDRDGYASTLETTEIERRELRALAERQEELTATLRRLASAVLEPLIAASQLPVVERIAELGGTVESTTIAGNLVIATVPAAAVAAVGEIPGVLRVDEDVRAEGHLTNAAASTMVDPADPSLLGLWDWGQNGAGFDPAIIDSGADLNHPALDDSAGRANWCSWYLAAADDDPDFGDGYTCDDLQGHGTHVQGIVGSYGSSESPVALGLAHGVERMVTLKAGWRNAATGRASMYWSDKYQVVDRALYRPEQLNPGTFIHEVDGFNLSYGAVTSLDDTAAGRFWDSVISTHTAPFRYAGLVLTMSAGDAGPSNQPFFTDPAVAYNGITVANLDDRGTASRDDDVLRLSSTRGPTAGGRRKPDIAAPGTSILAPSHDWEDASPDYVNRTGSSAAAPMVLGVLIDLMDAGLRDTLGLKAVLLNTAQKNLPSLDFEDDSDGWSPGAGWGVMNAYAAFQHRFDVFRDSVTPRGTAGSFWLYRGVMRDEGPAGEGRDRATLVWHRHATYDPAAPPATFYDLVDLDLSLYREEDGAEVDSDAFGGNVQQVRIDPGAGETDVVVKAWAFSSTFAHGRATENYALATEEGFERVGFPGDPNDFVLWKLLPRRLEPGEQFDAAFEIQNSAELAVHGNSLRLELPPSWSLVAGDPTQYVGSAAVGESTSRASYTVRVSPFAAEGLYDLPLTHRHSSYGEHYVNELTPSVEVEFDTTPPSPDPMTFSVPPFSVSPTIAGMTATRAIDARYEPVEYYLDFTHSSTGGSGGNDSGWQGRRSFLDRGLEAGHTYCYRARARDHARARNQTAPSATYCISPSCPETLELNGYNLTGILALEATESIRLTGSKVPAGALLSLVGGQSVELGDGTIVDGAASLSVFIDPGADCLP